MMIQETLESKGDKYILKWHDSVDFSDLRPIKQVYGVCFNDSGEILIVNTTGKWCLPGGTPEAGESFEGTLIRETDEEGDVEISNIEPIGYQGVEHFRDEKLISIIYQLRFVAKITNVKGQSIDPAENKVPERKFIKPEEFLDYCPWGETGKAMIARAIDVSHAAF